MSKKKSKNKGLIKGFRGLLLDYRTEPTIDFSDIRFVTIEPYCIITYFKVGKRYRAERKTEKIDYSELEKYKVHLIPKTARFNKEYAIVDKNQSVIGSWDWAQYTDYIRSKSDKRYDVFETNEQMTQEMIAIKYTIPLWVYINSLTWGTSLNENTFNEVPLKFGAPVAAGESVAVKDLRSGKLLSIRSVPVSILIECPDKRFIVIQ